MMALVYLVTCISLPLVMGQGSGFFGPGDPDDLLQLNSRCEGVTIPICRDLPYNMTLFPNALGHEKQSEAGIEAQQFSPLIQIDCSPHMKMLICSLYAPICTMLDEILPPCRSLCELSRTGCEPVMIQFGFRWPKHMECRRFPTDGLCVKEQPDSDTEGSDDILEPPDPELPEICEPVTTPMCKDVLPYNTTGVHNVFNHTDHHTATVAVHEWRPLVEYDCSPYLQSLLCHIYIPSCSHYQPSDDHVSSAPCRDLCEKIRANCSHVVELLQFHWPPEISCDVFPVMGHCTPLASVDETWQITTTEIVTTTMADAAKCEPITTSICHREDSNFTTLPNILGHLTQVEAVHELHNFKPVFSLNCGNQLESQLCEAFLPLCVQGQTENITTTEVERRKSMLKLCHAIIQTCGRSIHELAIPWPEDNMCDFDNSHISLCASLYSSVLHVLLFQTICFALLSV